MTLEGRVSDRPSASAATCNTASTDVRKACRHDTSAHISTHYTCNTTQRKCALKLHLKYLILLSMRLKKLIAQQLWS